MASALFAFGLELLAETEQVFIDLNGGTRSVALGKANTMIGFLCGNMGE